jgi:hypothetical protein
MAGVSLIISVYHDKNARQSSVRLISRTINNRQWLDYSARVSCGSEACQLRGKFHASAVPPTTPWPFTAWA